MRVYVYNVCEYVHMYVCLCKFTLSVNTCRSLALIITVDPSVLHCPVGLHCGDGHNMNMYGYTEFVNLDIRLHYPFLSLSLDHVLEVIGAFLLEQRILFTSTSYTLLTYNIEVCICCFEYIKLFVVFFTLYFTIRVA